jgi:hypothetical protein
MWVRGIAGAVSRQLTSRRPQRKTQPFLVVNWTLATSCSSSARGSALAPRFELFQVLWRCRAAPSSRATPSQEQCTLALHSIIGVGAHQG